MSGVMQLKYFSISYLWTVVNFSSLPERNGGYVESPNFGSPENPEVKWAVDLYPHGYGPDSIEYISIFVRCKESYPGEIHGDFKIHILDKDKNIYLTKSQTLTFDDDIIAWGWWYTMRRTVLFENAQKLLPGDNLTIKCEMSYYPNTTKPVTSSANNLETMKTTNSKTTINVQKNEGKRLTNNSQTENQVEKSLSNSSIPTVPPCQMSKQPSILFDNDKLSDVILINRGKEFHAHKAILAARSPIFESMFVKTTGPQLPRVEIPDLEQNVVNEMLRFIYTYRVENVENLALDLLVAANAYGLEDLKMVCAQELLKAITVKDAPDVLIIADKFRSDYLKEKLKYFMINHATEVVSSPQFKALTLSHPDLAHWALDTSVNVLGDGNIHVGSFVHTKINHP